MPDAQGRAQSFRNLPGGLLDKAGVLGHAVLIHRGGH